MSFLKNSPKQRQRWWFCLVASCIHGWKDPKYTEPQPWKDEPHPKILRQRDDLLDSQRASLCHCTLAYYLQHSMTEIEVCIESVEGAKVASQYEATRVELCANLNEGGTTPSAGMIAVVHEALALTRTELYVMIRRKQFSRSIRNPANQSTSLATRCLHPIEYWIELSSSTIPSKLGCTGHRVNFSKDLNPVNYVLRLYVVLYPASRLL